MPLSTASKLPDSKTYNPKNLTLLKLRFYAGPPIKI
jgi:hypothetical protein